MAAMEVVLANTIRDARPPVTGRAGGTSVGDAGAGGRDVGRSTREFGPVSGAQRAGASILTVLVILGLVAGVVFVVMDESRPETLSDRLGSIISALSVTSSWSRSLLKLQGRSSSGELKEKGVDRSSGNPEGPQQQDMAEKGQGMVSWSGENAQSKPAAGETTRRRGGSGSGEAETQMDRGSHNISCPGANGRDSVLRETAVPRPRAAGREERVQRMDIPWEEEEGFF
jgi:hypothetical protein